MGFKNLDGVQIIVLIVIAISAIAMLNSLSEYNNVKKIPPNEYITVTLGEGEYDSVIYSYKELEEMKENKISSFMISTIISFAGVAAFTVYSIQIKKTNNE